MVTLETVLDVVPALGMIVALVYYCMTLRNTSKARQRELIFLRFQSFDMPYVKALDDVMYTWTDREHFHDMRESACLTTRYQNVGLMRARKY